ncbi:hypothetical protein FQZ97_1226790 [compost metagenome]
MSYGLEVGAFDFFSPPMVDHQALGDGAQKGAWGSKFQAFATLQQAHEGVLGQVRGIGGVAQLAAQPSIEPAVMTAVERLYCKLGR